MDGLSFLLLLFYMLQTINTASSSCANGFMPQNIMRSRVLNRTVEDVRLLNSEVRIIPDMRFTCNGTITGIYLSGRIKGCCNDYPQLLVWEPAGTPRDDASFYRDGGSTFNLLSATNIEVTRVSPHGYYYYKFKRPIQFYEGNVLGIYQPSNDDAFQIAYDASLSDAPLAYACPRKRGESINQSIDITNTNIVQPRPNQTLLISPKLSTNCLQNALHYRIVKSTEVANSIVLGGHLRLFPDIIFKCAGYITHWLYGLRSDSSNGTEPVQLQIWRPTEKDNGSEGYTLINSTSISSNIFIKPIQTQLLQTPIPVMKNDVLGVYQPPNAKNDLLYREYGGPDNLIVQKDEVMEGGFVRENKIKGTCSDHYPLVSASFVTVLPSSTVTAAASSTVMSSSSETKAETSSQAPDPTVVADEKSEGMPLMIIIIVSSVTGGVMLLLIVSVLVLVMILRNKRGFKSNNGSDSSLCNGNSNIGNGAITSSHSKHSYAEVKTTQSPAPYEIPAPSLNQVLPSLVHSSSVSKEFHSILVPLSDNVSYAVTTRPTKPVLPVLPNVSYGTGGAGSSSRVVKPVLKPAVPVKPNVAYNAKLPTPAQPLKPALPIQPKLTYNERRQRSVGESGVERQFKPAIPVKPNVSYNSRRPVLPVVPVHPNISYQAEDNEELEDSCEYAYPSPVN